MKLTLAQPDHAEHIARFYQSIHGEEFPHPEMFEAATVAQLLRDEELAVVVASDAKRILGCGLGFPQTWNASLEIGALTVDDVEERNQIGKALFEALRRLGLKTYGVAFFRARTEASFRRARSTGATCWGFRPAPGARTVEDCELVMGLFEDDGDAVRVQPPDNAVTRLPFAQRIIASQAGHEGEIPYPKNFPVGAPRGTGTPVISGRIWPTYHSRGNFITIESSAGPYPVEIIREFVGKVRQKGVSDVRLALPVNQEAAFLDLVDFGFSPVAYLPGWFLRGAHRFDCIEMVAGLPRIPRDPSTFMERAVKKVADGLQS